MIAVAHPTMVQPFLFRKMAPMTFNRSPVPRTNMDAANAPIFVDPFAPANRTNSVHPTPHTDPEVRVQTVEKSEERAQPSVYVGFGELVSPELISPSEGYFRDNGEGDVHYFGTAHSHRRPPPPRRASISVQFEREREYYSKRKRASSLENVGEKFNARFDAPATTSPSMHSISPNHERAPRPRPPPLTLAPTSMTASTAPSFPVGGSFSSPSSSDSESSSPDADGELEEARISDSTHGGQCLPVNYRPATECATPAEYFAAFLRK